VHRMTLLTTAVVQRTLGPGWDLLPADVPLGTPYVVDLDRRRLMTLEAHGQVIRLPCIYVVSPAIGWLPCLTVGLG
jgi:hypothetical protein